ncbi:MAG: T9SS type A sorting domain-containing protein [Ignavibacteriaceae bacterium]|nr:T9SS type A sorting domain-containing protein [Ignavibacteriaceae bacterium]
MFRYLLKLVFTVFLYLCFSNLYNISFCQQSYTVIDLGTFGELSSAVGINNKTQIVGYSRTTGNQPWQAFLWEDGSMINIGSLGNDDTWAYAINDSGQIVGESYLPAMRGGPPFHGYLWESGVMIDLQTLGGNYSRAHDINNLSQIVGQSTNDPNDTAEIAFLWQGGPMINLNTGGWNSNARGINDSGKIVGSYFGAEFFDRAFIWMNGVTEDIGTLGGDGAEAYDINKNGKVVGRSYTAGNLVRHAFLWDGNTMIDLHAPGTSGESRAVAINDKDEIICLNNSGAFLYKNDTLYNLNDLIDPNSGWILGYATDINNKSEIVGQGSHNGQARAFLLTPFSITHPHAGELWIAGETDTIKWNGGTGGQFFNIEFSIDSGNTYSLITIGVPADSGYYIWNIPQNILSTKVKIKISDVVDSTTFVVSGIFKIKGYVLTRLTPDGNYEAFKPSIHGWNYLNGTLWPQTWWSQFHYATAIDPYTSVEYPNFFHSVADSSFIDWPLWVDVFGEDQCYYFTQIPLLGSSYKGEAEVKWKDRATIPPPGSPQGSCFGFAASSFLAFNFGSQFFPRHPGIPNVPNIFSLNLTNTIQKTINGYYAYQHGRQSLDNDVIGKPKDPRTTLQEIKNLFINDSTNIRTITIYNNNGTGGGAHTMAPISVTVDGSGPSRYRVNLYDSNNPGLNTPYILVDSLNNTWTDFTGLGVTWTGNSHFYLEIPVSNYFNTPIMGKHFPISPDNIKGTGNIEFYNTEKANVIYTSSTGNKIGVVNGVVTDEIDNGIAIFNKTGKPSDPIGYYIPDDTYSATLSNIVDVTGRVYLSAFKSNVIYDYSRENANATQMDKFRIDEGFSVISPDPEDKQINLEVIAKLDSSERILFINETQLRQNDSLYITELNQSEFVIKNYGTAKTYTLELNDRSSLEQEIFEYPLVDLQANSAQTLQPNWDNLYGSQLMILIDLGIDGTIDDTLRLDNTVNVEDQGSLLSPNNYNLAQNYPNPFNPSTTIQFSIPQRSNVTLKVYDVLGNEVTTLVNEEKERGVYTISFNASALASGMYLYRIQAGLFVETKKMILLK